MSKFSEVFALKPLFEVFKPSSYKNLPQQLTDASKDLQSVAHWSTTWGQRVYAFSIWGQVITSTLNPILMYFQYKGDPNIAPKERRMLITQEVAKQFVQICLHVGVMLGFARAFKSYLNKMAKGIAEKSPEMAKRIYSDVAKKEVNKDLVDAPMGVIANLAGCLAAAVFLPIVGATLFKAIDRKLGLTGESHDKQHGGDAKPGKDDKSPQASGNLNVLSLPPGVAHTAAYHGVPVVHQNHPVHLQGQLPSQAPSPFRQTPMASLR